jgi:hypothetical protein
MEQFITTCYQHDNFSGWDLLSCARTVSSRHEYVESIENHKTDSNFNLILDQWQSGAIQNARLSPSSPRLHSSITSALQSMKPLALVMPVRSDLYFVPQDSQKEVKSLPHGTLRIIESIYGHTGGGGGGSLEDKTFINKEVARFMKLKRLGEVEDYEKEDHGKQESDWLRETMEIQRGFREYIHAQLFCFSCFR